MYYQMFTFTTQDESITSILLQEAQEWNSLHTGEILLPDSHSATTARFKLSQEEVTVTFNSSGNEFHTKRLGNAVEAWFHAKPYLAGFLADHTMKV